MTQLIEAISVHAMRQPASCALVGTDQTLSYRQLLTEVLNCADLLHANTIGLLLDNGPAWVIVDLAVQLRGITVVPLPLFFTDAQLRHIIAAAAVDCIFTDQPARVQQLAQVVSLAPLTIGRQPLAVAHVACETTRSAVRYAKLTFTSGTTGRPKGVCLQNAPVDRVTQALLSATNATSEDRSMSVLPLASLLENIAVATTLTAGACACVPSLQSIGVSMNGLAMTSFCRALMRHQPTGVVLVPELLRGLVTAVERGWSPPSSLRLLAVGGAPVAAGLLLRAQRLGLPVYEGYGLTEAASVVCLNRPGSHRSGSVGRALPHARVEIAGDGEVLVGGALFSGYLGDPPFSSDLLSTGDLGHLDDEGYLHLTGRKSSVIATAYGRNVSPEWPERELMAEPGISQAAVFGEGRHCLVAVICAESGAKFSQIAAGVAAANQRLPDYAQIERYHVAEHPFSPLNGELTVNGRPRRPAIAKRFEAVIDMLYQESVHAVP